MIVPSPLKTESRKMAIYKSVIFFILLVHAMGFLMNNKYKCQLPIARVL